MSRAADRLDKKCAKLYRAKRYMKLFDTLMAQKDGDLLFIELYKEDDDLIRWWCQQQKEMWDSLNNNPEKAAEARAMFQSGGMEDLFDFQMRVHDIGFASAEEIAEMYGCTVKDIEETVAENPELFKGHAITGMVQ